MALLARKAPDEEIKQEEAPPKPSKIRQVITGITKGTLIAALLVMVSSPINGANNYYLRTQIVDKKADIRAKAGKEQVAVLPDIQSDIKSRISRRSLQKNHENSFPLVDANQEIYDCEKVAYLCRSEIERIPHDSLLGKARYNVFAIVGLGNCSREELDCLNQ
ncbi:hypothetical protein JKY72_01770 [Candidatus Gracilibacteria bacterium]|nr:hypothetical protein [Candidatus Gracilibacteria bacterium]